MNEIDFEIRVLIPLFIAGGDPGNTGIRKGGICPMYMRSDQVQGDDGGANE